MRIGLALPHYGFSFPGGEPLDWERLVDAARRAERLGFDSVWISDHFFLSLARYGGPEDPYDSVEPLSALVALAPLTERVRLGTLVLGAGFRHPATLAKAATTIDLASGGRLDLGLGAGWYEDEYRAFGYPFGTAGERFELLEETVAVVAKLLREAGPSDFQGRLLTLRGAYNNPRPAREGGPPLWIGSKGGPRSLSLIAREADGWNTVWRWTPEDYRAVAARLDEACERAGRDPGGVRRSVGLYTLVGEDEADLVARYRALQRWAPGGALDGELIEDYARGALVGTPEQIAERVASFAALGAEEIVVAAASVPFAVYDDSMLELFSEAVIQPAAATR